MGDALRPATDPRRPTRRKLNKERAVGTTGEVARLPPFVFRETTVSLADQPAFPRGQIPNAPGMTYRQWLVGKALQGLVANDEVASHYKKQLGIGVDVSPYVANEAIKLADAAIRAQEKS